VSPNGSKLTGADPLATKYNSGDAASCGFASGAAQSWAARQDWVEMDGRQTHRESSYSNYFFAGCPANWKSATIGAWSEIANHSSVARTSHEISADDSFDDTKR
jgi:hypothetical protein